MASKTIGRHSKPLQWVGATALAGALCVATQSHAGDYVNYPAGYYIGAQGGYNIVHNTDLDAVQFNASPDISGGGAGTLAAGYDYQSPWRAEIEMGYRSNGVDEVEFVPATGDIKAFTAMANLFYDFDVDAFSPYIGLGIGAAFVKADDVTPVNGLTTDDGDVTYAGQLMLGAAYQVLENVALTGQYTFLAAPEISFGHPSGDDLDTDYFSHAFTVGLRYMFGPPSVARRNDEPALLPPPPPPPSAAQLQAEEEIAAAAEPPPPPPPPPEPELAAVAPEPTVRNFIIYFDWDSAVVTPNAMQTLTAAADYAATGNYAVVTLTGHTDTSGTKKYNQALSERRAAAAKMILVQQGITAASIATSAVGENELAVQTADGIRESQNRRVEIRIE